MANRVLLSTVGLKVSKAGFNVLTETDPQNLLFDSTQPILGQALIGSTTLTSGELKEISYGFTLTYYPVGFAQHVGYSHGGRINNYYQRFDISGVRVYGTGVDLYLGKSSLYLQNTDTLLSATVKYIVFYQREGA